MKLNFKRHLQAILATAKDWFDQHFSVITIWKASWKHLFLPGIIVFRNIVIGFCIFLLLVRIYPWIGGVSRSEFISQQLYSTIQEFANGHRYELFELNFTGLNDKSYVVVIDKTSRKYINADKGDYRNYHLEGETEFVVLQQAQLNPLDKLIFSKTYYKKAFTASFPQSESTFTKVLSISDYKDIFAFCLDNNRCGRIALNTQFEIEPLIKDYSQCSTNEKFKGIELTKLNSQRNVRPMIHLNKNDELFIAFGIDEKKDGEWVRSTPIQFCVADFPFEYSLECYVTKERYTEGGINTVTGDITKIFEADESSEPFFHQLLFEKLNPC